METLAKKSDNLQKFLKTHTRAAVAFSGGTDSAYLLYAAKRNGLNVQPYYIKTAFQPQFELNDALRMAEKLALHVKIITADILRKSQIAANTEKRCYHCKRMLFSLLKKQAAKDGYAIIFDGTNASDKAENRPGIKVLGELGIQSPLREYGITKAEVRCLSKKAGLFTWNKSAYACLATRVPYGTKIKTETLSLIEQAESRLSVLGFSDFRVRISGYEARLQVPKAQMKRVLQKKKAILQMLAKDFSSISLDLTAR